MTSPSGDGEGQPVGPPARSREEILAALAAMPEDLGRTLSNRSRDDLMRPSRDGGWGVVEILCHLRDWEEIFLERARAIVERERPDLPAFDDDLWAIERDYRGQDPGRVLERFRELRAQLVEFLAGLPAAAWQRRGVHAVHGEITLRWLIEELREHGEAHLAQIRQALA